MSERVPLACLLPLRLLVGVILVLEGFGKLRAGWLHGVELHQTLGRWLASKQSYAFFVPLVEHAHEHPKIFGTLVTLGELLIGASFVVGFLNRPAALLGLVMMGSIALAQGQGLAPPGSAVLMAVICLVFMFASPGRVLGVDRALRGRVAGWIA